MAKDIFRVGRLSTFAFESPARLPCRAACARPVCTDVDPPPRVTTTFSSFLRFCAVPIAAIHLVDVFVLQCCLPLKPLKLHPRFESLPAEAPGSLHPSDRPHLIIGPEFSSRGHAASGNRRPSWSGPGLLPPPASFPKRCAFGQVIFVVVHVHPCPWVFFTFRALVQLVALSAVEKSSVCFTSFGLSAFAFGACRFSIPSRPPLCPRSKQGQHHEGSLLLAVAKLQLPDTRRHSHILLFRAMCSVL